MQVPCSVYMLKDFGDDACWPHDSQLMQLYQTGTSRSIAAFNQTALDQTAFHLTGTIATMSFAIHSQVKAAIKRGSNAKRTIAAFFFALSGAYIRARRVKNGVDLKWAVQPRPLTALVWALLTVAILAPFHRQASALAVFG